MPTTTPKLNLSSTSISNAPKSSIQIFLKVLKKYLRWLQTKLKPTIKSTGHFPWTQKMWLTMRWRRPCWNYLKIRLRRREHTRWSTRYQWSSIRTCQCIRTRSWSLQESQSKVQKSWGFWSSGLNILRRGSKVLLMEVSNSSPSTIRCSKTEKYRLLRNKFPILRSLSIRQKKVEPCRHLFQKLIWPWQKFMNAFRGTNTCLGLSHLMSLLWVWPQPSFPIRFRKHCLATFHLSSTAS